MKIGIGLALSMAYIASSAQIYENPRLTTKNSTNPSTRSRKPQPIRKSLGYRK